MMTGKTRVSGRCLRRLGLLLIYLVAVAVFFEVASRIALSFDTILIRVVAGANDNSSNRLRWVYRHRRQVEIHYVFDQFHPTRGWANRPHVRNARIMRYPDGGHWTVNTNSRGLRGRTEYAQPKPPGTIRIVVLGDSFTFGEEVDDDDTYCAQLNALLAGTEVLNLGVHGYGHDQMLIYLTEEGVGYSPDIVIVGFVTEDVQRNVVQFKDYAKPRFSVSGGRLHLHNRHLHAPEEMIRREFLRSKALDLLVIFYQNARWQWRSTQEEMETVTSALLREMAATSRAAGAVPLYVYLPVLGELAQVSQEPFAGEEWLDAVCRAHGIDMVSLRPAFNAALAASEVFDTTRHWEPAAHRVAARALALALQQRRLVPDRAVAGKEEDP